MEKGLLLVISGPSGTGKGTICKELIRQNPQIEISVSATTRKPREGEIDTVNYFFLNEDRFKRMIVNQDFLEYAKVYDNFYGTPKKNVFKKLEQGKDVLLEIDIQGALSVKKIYPDAVLIFILPPSMNELKNRIIKRGTETEESISKRFNSAYEELKYVYEYKYAVINKDVNVAVERIEAIIEAEKCVVCRLKNTIDNVKEV